MHANGTGGEIADDLHQCELRAVSFMFKHIYIYIYIR